MLNQAYRSLKESEMARKAYRFLKRKPKKGRPTGEDWHRRGVGGLWDEIGKAQTDYLVNRGLKPEHYLLDIGCGSLRGGVRFINYLDTGHYYGIEKEPSLLEAGCKVELKRYHLEHKNPYLFLIDDFDLSSIRDIQFEFMLAQSVLNHLTVETIELCLRSVMPRLKPNGVFYATINLSEDGSIDQGVPHHWRRDERNNTRYPFSLFQQMSKRLDLSVECANDYDHPRGTFRMLVFRRIN